MQTISDPRPYPITSEPASGTAVAWQALIDESAAAPGLRQRAALESSLEQDIAAVLARGDTFTVRGALESSRSAAEYRQLWRAVIAAWRLLAARADASVVAHCFAIPVVVVAGGEQDHDLPMTIRDPQSIVDAMREQGALGGNRNFGIGSVLVGERWVGLDAVDAWPRPEAIGAIGDIGPWVDALPASPIHVVAGRESAHLRWLPGSALAAPGTDLFTDRQSGKWGLKAADSMSRGFSAGGAQVLALPGAPADILSAWQQGLVAHREVALQLFASSTVRNLRASFGEPAAVVSAHRTDPGELRISLSSPFGERDAEGFRCPLHPFERIDDVLKSIADLLNACRLTDVTVLPGVHPDRAPRTGLPLFFRADQLPDQNIVQL